MVGRSGRSSERRRLPTPSSRSFPVFTCGSVEGMLKNATCTSSPSRAMSAGVAPLYGTCVISTRASILKSSPAMWVELPVPLDAKLSARGFAFA